MLSQNDINNVENVIQQLIDSLSICRQQITELHIENQTKEKSKDIIDVIKSSQQQFHHIVNEYFKDLGETFRSLQSKFPNAEIKRQLILKLEEYTQQLEVYSEKIQTNKFSQIDFEQFQQQNYPVLISELAKEIDELHQCSTQNNKKQDVELLPQVKVNHRIVEGLLLTLNDYASVQWSGDIQLDQTNKALIDQKPINTNSIIILDEMNQQYGQFDIEKQQYVVKQYHSKVGIDYSATVVQGDQQIVYFIGGVGNAGNISPHFHKLEIESGQVTQLPEMNVKRVGCFAILIQEDNQQYFYVLGGKTDNKVKTKLCERFNFITQKWEFIPKMNYARASAGIAQHEDFLYVFFGIDSENQNLNIVERYSLKAKVWEVINIQNLLPGFDCSNCAAVGINKNQIILLGGIRYSLYYQNQMYFNRKVLLYNITNQTFSILDNQLPVDFLPYSQLILYNDEIYSIGYLMKQTEDKPSIFLDGGFVLKLNKDYIKIVKYIPSYKQK